MSTRRPDNNCSLRPRASSNAFLFEKSTYAKPLFWAFPCGFEVPAGKWIRVIVVSVKEQLLVKNLRRSSFVARNGRFPIQTPYSERCLSGRAEEVASAFVSGATDVASIPFFFALRKAFLEG